MSTELMQTNALNDAHEWAYGRFADSTEVITESEYEEAVFEKYLSLFGERLNRLDPIEWKDVL